MFITNGWNDYKVLDTGDGMKLEQWGDIILSRPDPQVIWAKQRPELWQSAHAEYVRSAQGGGEWNYLKKLPERWTISYHKLRFYVRPTGFKHTGLFPEQAANWDFMTQCIGRAQGAPRILNLFAYTGGATLACAAAGAQVTHIDAAKSMNGWARENLELSGLSQKPVRVLADDCLKFVLREQRRGNRYDGIIMDPPSYGRGADGKVFRTEDNLFELVRETSKLLSDTPVFFIINSYTTGLSSVVCKNILEISLGKRGGSIDAGDLCLPVEGQNILLPCGTTTRWTP
ncbi:MAG: class I SAM-dependent methyltransferase [Christensenella sp.]|uniref:class I SAM-dependent methyltransferase n=1 Tax=Christensenella sp. TaxID=1935934 RepID=UPI002B20215B|nr:class I SAM-dependent methyltransferase [Christensenella sp.]MEA5003106.1 class I SAM-dependent methyltransferase [Christensenella sp.]